MRRFACLAAMLVVGILAFGASTADAGTVRWFGGCYTFNTTTGQVEGGTATTAAGPLAISFGWGTTSVARTQKFLEYQSISYTINGVTTTTAVGDSTGWGPIQEGLGDLDGDGVPETTIYSTRWTSPVLTTLASGQSVTVSASLKTSKTVWDTDKIFYKAETELLGAFTTCTITAT